MSATTVKNAIKANLDALVTAGTLGAAETSDLKKDPLAEIPGYPYAALMPPSIESMTNDNRSNLRAYVYEIMIIWKAENITDATTVENDLEAVLKKFDNDPTLDGTALGGVQPVSLSPQPIQHAGRDLIMAVVQIKAKEVVQLTFS
jgi:hypothetical protein